MAMAAHRLKVLCWTLSPLCYSAIAHYSDTIDNIGAAAPTHTHMCVCWSIQLCSTIKKIPALCFCFPAIAAAITVELTCACVCVCWSIQFCSTIKKNHRIVFLFSSHCCSYNCGIHIKLLECSHKYDTHSKLLFTLNPEVSA